MRQARELYSGADSQVLAGTYKSARDQLDRAWEFFREQQYRASLKLAKQVERAARKMLENEGRERQAEANYDRRANEVQRALSRVQERLAECGSEAAEQLVARAREAFQLAARVADEGNYRAALRALQKSHELAGEAQRVCAGEDNLDQRLDRLSDRADRIGELIAPGDDRARTMLSQARQQITMAREFLASDRLDAARAAAKAAQLTLSELQRQIEMGGKR
jgi:hypothetical protein